MPTHKLSRLHSYDSFQRANEDVDQGPNDEQQILARDYADKVKDFTAKKAQFAAILAKDPAEWEKLAEPIVGTNVYLGFAWRAAKLAKSLEDQQGRVAGKTGPDLQRAQRDIAETGTELKELETELKRRMDDDKKDMPAK